MYAHILCHGAVLQVDAMMKIFKYDGMLWTVLVGLIAYLLVTVHLLCSALNNVSNGYSEYFHPAHLAKNPHHKSSLTALQRLTNITHFLRAGRIKTRDPSFTL